MPQDVEDWGLIDYKDAYQRQKDLVNEVINGARDRLIFCQHPPVLTLGRMTRPDSLLYTRDLIEAQGVSIYSVDRGGDITLHAPGQLVAYPIINLNHYGRDLKAYMQKLEQISVDLLTDFGILALSIPGKRGVFVQLPQVLRTDKIISIGVGVRKWVTYHGLGINVATDLSLFRLIKPCGLDVQMTSMEKLVHKPVPIEAVRENLIKQFNKYFGFPLARE